MFEFLENGSADDGGDGWICGILWNGNGLFLSDYPSRNPAADRLESDCAGLLPEMPADYILCILAAIMARRLRPMVQAYL